MGAVGCCGLQLYSYGQTVSIPFFRENWTPDSFYDYVAYNLARPGGGMHTLALLGEASDCPFLHALRPLSVVVLSADIKVKEPDFQAMARGETVFLPPRFMSVNEAAAQVRIRASFTSSSLA
jgi:diphthine synthase